MENMKKKGTYNDYLKWKKDAMAERWKKTITELAVIDDDCRKTLLDIWREKETKRKVEYRKKKANTIVAAESVSPLTCVYKLSSAKGRALAKVNKQFPTSPRQCREVKILAFEQMKIKPFSSKIKQRKQWNEIQLENLVCDFYQQDDISRQAPGKDDVMVVRNPGESKSKKQKHQLQIWYWRLMSCGKIERLASQNLHSFVLLLCCWHQLHRNVCICKYHENVILLLDALHRYDQTLPKYDESFTSVVVCDKDEEECWNNLCPQCKDDHYFKDLYPLTEQCEYIDETDSEGPCEDGREMLKRYPNGVHHRVVRMSYH